MLACKKNKMTDKTVDISVKNLARVHARNRELSAAAQELFACLDWIDGIMQSSMKDHLGETMAHRVKTALKQYKDIK